MFEETRNMTSIQVSFIQERICRSHLVSSGSGNENHHWDGFQSNMKEIHQVCFPPTRNDILCPFIELRDTLQLEKLRL